VFPARMRILTAPFTQCIMRTTRNLHELSRAGMSSVLRCSDVVGLQPREPLRNSLGITVAFFDSLGDLGLAGSLSQNSSPTTTPGSQLVVKNVGGAVVATVDSNGNLVLAGSMYENEVSLAPPSGSFVVKNAAGDVVAYITSGGDLHLAGEAHAAR